MYVRTFASDELEITPYRQNDTLDNNAPTISIDEVAFIYYGIQDPDKFVCS